MKPIKELAIDLASGRTTARVLAEAALAKINEKEEGARAFIKVDPVKVRATADALDALRMSGAELSPFSGIPLAIKDLYGVKGEVTTAGSVLLKDAPPEEEDAPSIAAMRRAGFVFVGRTNMTEFAYSGLGLNPHYGNPRSPWEREVGRVAGGSSSGSAVAVSAGMAAAALGTDTGGSCRIPAAFCGIVGYKPTASRISLKGIEPLSGSLDSAGPLGLSVDCCAAIDALLAGEDLPTLQPLRVQDLRLAIPKAQMFDNAEEAVVASFERAVGMLKDAGASIIEIGFDILNDIPKANAKGGFAASEAYAWHKERLAEKGALYDPRVGSRIAVGANQSAVDYIQLLQERARIIAAANAETVGFDAVIAPTVAIVPPRIDFVDDDANYAETNLRVLRNTAFANFLDRCAISIPCHREGEAPVGFMLMGEQGGDRRLFTVAKTVEALLAAR